MNNHIKALIVDDEIDICFLLSGILKKNNMDTTYVNSITEAKKMLEKRKPNILLLDNHLPDGKGVNFIREVKNNYPGIKVIMITAHDTSADQNAAYAQGADAFIGKPFTRASITRAVDSLIN